MTGVREGRTRLTIISCEEVHSGVGRTGKPYSIYEVEALDDAGVLITERLRSFADLRINELIEYDVKHYVHPRQGNTYTIYPL